MFWGCFGGVLGVFWGCLVVFGDFRKESILEGRKE